jgi:hypothetical protein
MEHTFANERALLTERLIDHVSHEIAFLNDYRIRAQIEAQITDHETLVEQIDARQVEIQSAIIPQIRDGIAAAVDLPDLGAVRRAYLDGRPQVVNDAIPPLSSIEDYYGSSRFFEPPSEQTGT